MKLRRGAQRYFLELALAVVAFVIIQLWMGYQDTAPESASETAAPATQAEDTQLATSPTTTLTAMLNATTSAAAQANWHPVERVVDGDTIKVTIANNTETVRIVGINTPETVDPRKPVECYGREASIKVAELLEGQSVQLTSDPTQQDRDRYNRLLRFVTLPDGQDLGEVLIREGFAEESLYSNTPHQYYERYQAAEREAQSAERGLWSPELCPSGESNSLTN